MDLLILAHLICKRIAVDLNDHRGFAGDGCATVCPRCPEGRLAEVSVGLGDLRHRPSEDRRLLAAQPRTLRRSYETGTTRGLLLSGFHVAHLDHLRDGPH